MNILEIKNELGKLKLRSDIKNENELYVYNDKNNIKDISVLLNKKYKYNFISEFAYEMEKNLFAINVLMSNSKEGYLVILRYKTEEKLISLQELFSQAHLFEREISDLYGLKIEGGKDTRNLVKHEIWEKDVFPLRKDFAYLKKIRELNEVSDYKFKPINGNEGFQIPVGPVHAGIIEPGHFRFSVIGEDIENLEIRLNYKHRGIEKIAENLDANKLSLLFERVACESSVAYAESYCILVEKLTRFQLPDQIRAVRVIFLELERIYNYLLDISGICIDVGFSYPSKKLAYLSEKILQLNERISGSRYLRNSIIPMGLNIDFTNKEAEDIRNTLDDIFPRMNEIINITLNSFTFLDRIEHTGIVKLNIAKKLLLTGPCGRASGINYDVRKSFSYELYDQVKKYNNIEEIGGVFERYKVKISEIKDGFKIIYNMLERIDKDIKKIIEPINLNLEDKEYFNEGFSMVETVKGELVVYGRIGKDNKFDRIYFKTPSFTNWKGLTEAVLEEIVPDFPLCNKSFNLSYSENDR